MCYCIILDILKSVQNLGIIFKYSISILCMLILGELSLSQVASAFLLACLTPSPSPRPGLNTTFSLKPNLILTRVVASNPLVLLYLCVRDCCNTCHFLTYHLMNIPIGVHLLPVFPQAVLANILQGNNSTLHIVGAQPVFIE